MRITVKTLEGKQFFIEVAPEQLVSEVKARIADSQGADKYCPALQKLVYQGKILDDAQPVAAYGLKEGGFIVCMVKPAPPAATAAEDHALAAGEAEASDEEQLSDDQQPHPTMLTAPALPGPALAGPVLAQQQQPEPQVDPAAVQRLVDVTGFQEEQVRAALMATYSDADAAVDFLMSGGQAFYGEEEEEEEERPPPPRSEDMGSSVMSVDLIPPGLQAQAQSAAAQAPASQPPSMLQQLRQHPQFTQLRMLVQSNPALLESVMQQIGQQNPEMLQAIQENPEEFLALLNEPVGAEPVQGTGGFAAAPAAPAAPPTTAPPSNAIELSAAESESVGRLEALGFGRQTALEAYIACDRNEELAANYLFDQMS